MKGEHRKEDVLSARVTDRVKAAYAALAKIRERSVSYLTGSVLTEWIKDNHPELMKRHDEPARTQVSGEVVEVPLYNVKASAGFGSYINEENLEKYLVLTRRFVADLGVLPDGLSGLRISGDSMVPEINDGDVVLIDTAQREPAAGSADIYVFRWGEELMIKRLRPLDNGGAVAISANSAFPPVDIPPGLPEEEFQIIGRVIVRWREF